MVCRGRDRPPPANMDMVLHCPGLVKVNNPNSHGAANQVHQTFAQPADQPPLEPGPFLGSSNHMKDQSLMRKQVDRHLCSPLRGAWGAQSLGNTTQLAPHLSKPVLVSEEL